MFVFFAFIVYSRLSGCLSEITNQTTDEQRLIETLFTDADYEANVRPVYNASDTVSVMFGYTLVKIMDMEETSQVLVTTAWLELSWLDERLYWDPAEYNGLEILRVPAEMLWLPDIVLYNNADDFTTGFMPGKAMIGFNGDVFWGPPARLRSSCLIDAGFFPFDIQRCTMKFGSWIYDASQVDILNMRPNVDVTRYVSNGEWELTNYTCARYEEVYPGPGQITFSDVKVMLVIQRRVLYYVLNILFSCIWLSILTLLDFCLPPDEGEKITLGTTVLLAYAFFMLLVANSVPPSSESLPLLGVYLTLSLAVNSLSLICTILVLRLHHNPAHRKPVPQWVRLIILQHLARLVGCTWSVCCSKENTESTSTDAIGEKLRNTCSELLENNVRWSGDYGGDSDLVDESRVGVSTPLHVSRHASFSEARVISLTTRKIIVNQMSKYLEYLSGNAKDDVEMYTISGEWKQVALVVDRFLFWLYLAVTLSATLAILLIVPSMRINGNGL